MSHDITLEHLLEEDLRLIMTSLFAGGGESYLVSDSRDLEMQSMDVDHSPFSNN